MLVGLSPASDRAANHVVSAGRRFQFFNNYNFKTMLDNRLGGRLVRKEGMAKNFHCL